VPGTTVTTTLGVVLEAVDHRRRHHGIAEDPAPAPEGFVGGDDDAGPFVAGRDELEEQVGRLGLEGDVADLVDDDERVAPRRVSSLCRRSAWWASARRATHSAAVAKATRCPASQARSDSPMARWVLPVPGKGGQFSAGDRGTFPPVATSRTCIVPGT
jgi:hypothetical protein